MYRKLIVTALPVFSLLFASIAVTGTAYAQPGFAPPPATQPTFQRRPVGQAPRGFFPPTSTQAFSFQRPYPYHLDYYRQKYNGGYEPYFGNLYGPPAVVGTQPFAYSGYPNNNPNNNSNPPQPQAAPQATPYITCPHCQQAVQLQWQPTTSLPPAPQ